MENYQNYGWAQTASHFQCLAEREKPRIINGVRIEPGCMVFKDAYDGKSFNQAVTITNCGKNSVNIRIFPPTSKAFKIKPMLIGHTLSTGLSIVRHVQYSYTKPTAIPQACMDIYVNNECVRYGFVVITCYTHVSVSPKVLDFGDIDVGMVSEVKKLTISNTGTKQVQYATDLGRNLLEIVVEPLKGTIQPGESKEMTVEVFGTAEGEFSQEFWIKTEPLQRVQIQGCFIEPNLIVAYPMTNKNLLILNFPRTFVGVRQQRNVVMQNHSSTSAVFCVNGRTESEKLPYKSASEVDLNFKQFDIFPLEGRLRKDQKVIMRVMFAPQRPKNQPNYYICNAVVDVRKCRADGNPCASQKRLSSEHSASQAGVLLDSISVSTVAEEPNESPQEITVFDDMITVIMYGEVELPEISIEPDKIVLGDLKVYETYLETLKISNGSTTLPLVMKYNKAANVEIEPKTIRLPPSQTLEATLKLRPTKMGDCSARISLDVLYQHKTDLVKLKTVYLDVRYSGEYAASQKLARKTRPRILPGITPKNCNEVGYLVDDLRFNDTTVDKPIQAIVDRKLLAFDKRNDALIAFPNDRPRILKPWRNAVPCKTIFAQLPRLITDVDVDYDLTPEQRFLRDSTRSYYQNYIMSLAKKGARPMPFEEELEDYTTTNQKRILLEHFGSKALCPSVFTREQFKQSLFVPLAPYEIQNTIVSPKFIQLGRLAANSDRSDCFKIENKNAFPIHISIKALYPSIRVNQAEFVLGPCTRKNIDFVYHSDNSGTRHIPMFIILNFFHVFDVTVLAKIVANTVQCVTKDIAIVPTEKTAFLELRNPINSDVRFEIDTTFFHLESFPSEGEIPAKRNMIVTITFNPEVGFSPVKEIAVISESGSKELIEVHFDHKKAAVLLSTEIITFKDVPLNTVVTQELVIVNNSDQLVPVTIELKNDLIPELTVQPLKALIWQKGNLVVTFTVKFREVVDFAVPVELTFQWQYVQQLTVKGNVVHPNVGFKPELIKIPKIPSGAMVRSPFKIMNNSEVPSYLLFPMDDYPEFVIRNKNGDNVTNDVLTMGPKERRDFSLEFQPQEPVVYCIYLPYIINDLLGPPELNCPETLRSSYYVSPVRNEYKTCANPASEKLRALKIICAASTGWLNFNTLQFDFYSFVDPPGGQDFEVTNLSGARQEVFIRTADIEAFTVTPASGDVVVESDVVRAILEPKASCVLTVEFMPIDCGKVARDVPIFVKDYSETVAFNFLRLSGDHPAPRISSSAKSLYFTPTYVKSRQTRKIALELTGHRCNKDIEVTHDQLAVDVACCGKKNESDFKTVVEYVVTFAPSTECLIEDEMTFSCPCSTQVTVEIFACSSNAIVTNFLSDPNVADQSTYPLFPLPDDQSNYAQLMRTVVAIIERWLYTQGFFYQNFYKIPDDIARYPVELSEPKKTTGVGKKTYPQLPLVQLLVNLMNTSILKYIDSGLEPSQILEKRAVYNYVTYRNTVAFLKSRGIQVPGLKPEHLLAYPEYVELKNSWAEKGLNEIAGDFDDVTFHRFSKQKWLDLFFHIYKVLVQERVVGPRSSFGEEDGTNNQDFEAFDDYLNANLWRFPDWFLCDARSLLWLEFHCSRQKPVLWPSERFEGHQQMRDFCDVDDSVSLATVTAAYCPYLKDHLKDMYALPKNLEQRVHNACKVVQSWKRLKLSFDVHPQTIVSANRIKIIFIVTYLYEVLPHFYPTEEVSIEAPLSESASYGLDVQNCGDVTIQYTAIFFGDSCSLFSLDCSSIVVPSGKGKTLKLTYMAKKVLEASAILVLSGEAGGQRYARSIAVKITGVPKTTSSDQIKLLVEVYKYSRKKVQIKSPYGKNYVAKIFICFEEPKSYKNLHSVAALRDKSVPREIDVLKSECEFFNKGEAAIALATCFLCQGPVHFYLYFCNDEVGDFCVLITLVPVLNKSRAQALYVDAPPNFKEACACTQYYDRKCPRNFTVRISSKNDLLWKCTETLIRKFFSEDSIPLLQRFFGTAALFRLLKFYLERFPQGFMLSSDVFADQVQLTVASSKIFSLPSGAVRISDVASDEVVPVVLHLQQDSCPSEAFLELRSVGEKEIRCYKLIFPKEKSNSGTSVE